MKRLLSIIFVLSAFIGNTQNYLTVRDGIKTGGTVITTTQLQLIPTISGKIDASTLEAATSTFYTKVQTDSIAALKASKSGDTFSGPIYIPTAAAGTNTTQAASTEFVQSSLRSTTFLEVIKELGSTAKAMTFACETPNGGTNYTLLDGTMYRALVYIDRDVTLTGVKCLVATNGDFTADNFNGIALYKLNGTNIEQVAISANDGSFWKVGTGVVSTIPFTSKYSAIRGVYFVVALYNNSAQVTAPALAIGASISTNNQTLLGIPNNFKIFGTNSSQTSLASSYTVSGATIVSSAVLFTLY